MTTLKDYLRELVNESVTLGQIDPPDLEDKKVELLYIYMELIEDKIIG